MSFLALAFSVNLRRVRLARGLTQRELAKRSGVAENVIQYLETRKRAPSLQTIEWLAQALDVSPLVMLEAADDESSAGPGRDPGN